MPHVLDRALFGFRQANEVPGEDGKLVFASAERDAVEVMFQTRESVLAVEPESARAPSARASSPGRAAVLFLEVDDLDAVETRTG
ncbi:MAG: hypothetical protein U5K74_07515 [Gemmatimonadaceae bacterium]|nr:hypothetical protein [Gemmatimonadaceae bacterium]